MNLFCELQSDITKTYCEARSQDSRKFKSDAIITLTNVTPKYVHQATLIELTINAYTNFVQPVFSHQLHEDEAKQSNLTNILTLSTGSINIPILLQLHSGQPDHTPNTSDMVISNQYKTSLPTITKNTER